MTDNTYKELAGGNVSKVYSDGQFVYRELTPQSRSIHRLLRHLEEKGSAFSPRLQEVTDQQEVLTFVPGETLNSYPKLPEGCSKTTIIQTAAVLLRTFHDATADFICQPDDSFFLTYPGNLPMDVICHNDFAPYNVTFEKDCGVGIIDFDTISPGPRVWDIAYALYRFAPLQQQVYDVQLQNYRLYQRKDAAEYQEAVALFLAAYGYEGKENPLEVLEQRLQSLIQLFDEERHKGNKAFITMYNDGHQQFYQQELAFIQENRCNWR